MTGPAMVPTGPYGAAAAVPPIPPELLRRRRSPLTWVTMIVLGLGALVIGILILLVGGPVATLVTTLLAAISFPLVILILFWLDRYEPEPARYRLAALGWGGVVAVALSVVAEQLLFALPGTSTFIETAIIAPVVEEAGKGLFLVVVVIFRRAQIHGLLDGLIYGALVGVGFAFVEDIVYYLSSLQAGALPVTFFLRGVMGPFAHPLFTAALGIGVGVAVTTRRPALRVLAPVLGYLGAVLMHAIWNGSAFWGGDGFFFTYAVIMLPLLAVVLAVAIWARSREGKMLGAALQQTVAMGWIRPEEIRWVARLSDRMSARSYAKRIGGKPAAAALHEYQQTMTEIAFLHNRAVHQTPPRDINERMNRLLQHAATLRPYVIMPPPPTGPGPALPPVPPPGWSAAPRPPGT
jgi:protease PrsW